MSSNPTSGEPEVRRKFQYVDLQGNSNKEWTIEVWPLGGRRYTYKTSYCRTGYNPQTTTKEGWMSDIDRLIRSKLRKGYTEVDLAEERVAGGMPTTGDGKVDELIAFMFQEANEYIGGYLSTKIDALSASQIREGRSLLLQLAQEQANGAPASDRDMIDLAERYYRAIPTKLPSRINAIRVVQSLLDDMHEQEERLEQLEAAIRAIKVETTGGQASAVDIVGAEIELAAPAKARQIRDMFQFGSTHSHLRHMGIKDVFQVSIPGERQRFLDCPVTNIKELWHGTRPANARHIVNGGLIIPRHAANGSMFGRGIYFADMASKSLQYCGSSRLKVMFLTDVRLGNQYIARDSRSSLTAAPTGYDSVWGKAGHTSAWAGYLQYNEFIVYRREQQSIRYIVTLA